VVVGSHNSLSVVCVCVSLSRVCLRGGECVKNEKVPRRLRYVCEYEYSNATNTKDVEPAPPDDFLTN
jgi:hypothetical protein